MAFMGVSVVIDNVDLTEHLISYERDKHICTGIGTIKIVLDKNCPVDFLPYDIVKLYEAEGELKGTYYIQTIGEDVPDSYLTIEAQDGSKLLQDYWISTVYEINYPSNSIYWVNKFLTEAGINYSAPETGSLMSNNTSLGMASVYEILLKLCQQNGWYFYFDSVNNCIIGNIQYDYVTNESFQITRDRILAMDKDLNDKMLRNKAIVWGNAQVSGKYWIYGVQQVSTPYGYDTDDYRPVVVSLTGLESQSEAQDLANKIVQEFAKITSITTLEIENETSLDIATSVSFTSDFGNGGGLVTSWSSRFNKDDGLITTLVLNERCPRVFAYFGISNDYVYVGTAGRGIWRKPLKGISQTWTSFGLDGESIIDLRINNDLFVAVTADGDAWWRIIGRSWTKVYPPLRDAEDGTIVNYTDLKAVGCTINKINDEIAILYNQYSKPRSWVYVFGYRNFSLPVMVGSGYVFSGMDIETDQNSSFFVTGSSSTTISGIYNGFALDSGTVIYGSHSQGLKNSAKYLTSTNYASTNLVTNYRYASAKFTHVLNEFVFTTYRDTSTTIKIVRQDLTGAFPINTKTISFSTGTFYRTVVASENTMYLLYLDDSTYELKLQKIFFYDNGTNATTSLLTHYEENYNGSGFFYFVYYNFNGQEKLFWIDDLYDPTWTFIELYSSCYNITANTFSQVGIKVGDPDIDYNLTDTINYAILDNYLVYAIRDYDAPKSVLSCVNMDDNSVKIQNLYFTMGGVNYSSNIEGMATDYIDKAIYILMDSYISGVPCLCRYEPISNTLINKYQILANTSDRRIFSSNSVTYFSCGDTYTLKKCSTLENIGVIPKTSWGETCQRLDDLDNLLWMYDVDNNKFSGYSLTDASLVREISYTNANVVKGQTKLYLIGNKFALYYYKKITGQAYNTYYMDIIYENPYDNNSESSVAVFPPDFMVNFVNGGNGNAIVLRTVGNVWATLKELNYSGIYNLEASRGNVIEAYFQDLNILSESLYSSVGELALAYSLSPSGWTTINTMSHGVPDTRHSIIYYNEESWSYNNLIMFPQIDSGIPPNNISSIYFLNLDYPGAVPVPHTEFSGYVNHCETTNLGGQPYYFVSVSGIPPRFYQADTSENGDTRTEFILQNTGLPNSNITVIRCDDRV